MQFTTRELGVSFAQKHEKYGFVLDALQGEAYGHIRPQIFREGLSPKAHHESPPDREAS